MRKDVANKDVELEQQAKKTTGESEEIYYELSAVKKDKQHLLEEIESLTESSQQKINREKERIAQLSQLEKENLETLFLNEKEALVGERNKLMQLCERKSEEIKRLYDQIKTMEFTVKGKQGEFLNYFCKEYSGCMNETWTMSDRYNFEMPTMNDDENAIFLGALQMIDMLFFEENYFLCGCGAA